MSDLLLPAENMALTVARAQIERRENPTPNVTAVLVMALDRLIDEIPDGDLYTECEHLRDEDLCDVMCDAYVRGDGMVKVE